MPFLPLRRRSGDSPPGAQPLITVGITSFQDVGVIDRCLESVVSQTLGAERIEVLVVDDGSSDPTTARAERFRAAAQWAGFTVRRHDNTGSPSQGRNTILTEARGKFVFFVDADDYLGPQALEVMTQAAQAQGADVVIGHYVGVNRSAPNVVAPREPKSPGEYHAGWLNSLHVQKLFRTDFLRSLPYRFNKSLIYASDHPFMISAFLHAQEVCILENVDCYFITLETPQTQQRGHVSRAEIPATKQLQFLHDCFGVLALARGNGGELAKLAGRMRVDYWNRLLKLHIPQLILRKNQDDDAVTALAGQALAVAEMYGAQTSRTRLTDGAQQMLEAIRSTHAAEIRETARLIRQP